MTTDKKKDAVLYGHRDNYKKQKRPKFDIFKALQKKHGKDFSPVVRAASLAVKLEQIADNIEITDNDSALKAVTAYRNAAITFNECSAYLVPRIATLKVEHSVDEISISNALSAALATADKFISSRNADNGEQYQVIDQEPGGDDDGDSDSVRADS